MSRHLIVEEEKRNLEPLLIVDTSSGIQNKLLDLIAESLVGKLKIFALTKKTVSKKINIISPLGIHYLDRLSNGLKYSIIFLDEESQKKKVLEILSKLSAYNTRTLILIPYRISEKFVDTIINIKEKKNITVGLVGDLFGESHLSSPISKIIESAISTKEVSVSGNELLPVFPISENDLINSVHSVLFTKKNDSLYSFFYEHPQTLLSLTHLLKRTEPELSISFKVENASKILGQTQEQKDRYIKDRTGLAPQKLDSLMGFEKSVEGMSHKISELSTESTFIKKERIRKKAGKIGRVFKALAFGFALYLLVSFVLFFASLLFFKTSILNATEGDLTKASQDIKIAKDLYVYSKIPTGAVVSVPTFFGNFYLYDYLNVYESILDDTPMIFSSFGKTQNSTLSRGELEKVFASLFELYFISQRYNLNEFYKSLKIENPEILSKFFSIFPVLPQVLGYDSVKNYILLLENNNELRPNGGFIGSVSFVSIKNGRVDDIKITDVYDLDGQLTGHVEPHFIIRRYLQPHLYLRDSNFNPDFEKSASMSAFLYNVITGKRANGVIAVDTDVLKEIMKITGAFKVAGVGEVNSENVVKIVQSSVKESFFPGSTAKKDILNSILNKIILTMEDTSKKSELIKILPKLIIEKHILFTFSSNAVNKAFSSAGFTGNLDDNRIKKNLLKDLIGINEANIGVNKVNEFIKRKVNYSAYLNSNSLDSEITIDYKNESKETYKAYLRVIVPRSSNLFSVSVENQLQNIVPAVTDFKIYERSNFKAPEGLEVDEELVDDKKIMGFIIDVPSNDNMRIKINFKNTSIIPSEGSFDYSLLYFKQPGTDKYPLTVTLQIDEGFKINSKSAVIFDKEIKTDHIVEEKVFRTRVN